MCRISRFRRALGIRVNAHCVVFSFRKKMENTSCIYKIFLINQYISMVHQYLKTCVLSVCVAALCGGRAFGGYFRCDVCKKAILDENWGSHNVEFQHGNKMPEVFFCNRCYVDWDGARKNVLYHYQEQYICRVKDKDGLDRPIRIPPFEEHVKKAHCVWEHTFWCSKCQKQIGVNSWIMHLYRECKCYDKIYKFEGSGLEEETFRCSLCEEGKKAVFPLILKYEHLRDNHREYLPKREFFCKSCKARVPEANWQEHKEKKHKPIDIFQCYICQEERRECYEKHMATRHTGRCSFPFCHETFSEEKRGEHMKKEHGFPCPICGEQIDTLLEVHAGRKHPFFEDRCKFGRSQQDSNGTYYCEPCKWPCFRVSGWMYIQHLRENVHMVSENGKNKEVSFKWCPRRDFLGQHDEVKEHVNLKHKDCSFVCQECNSVDVWRNEQQHRQVKHEKTHWWCMDCAKVFPYQSKDEKERSASRDDHLLTVHKDIYAKCPGCGDVVRMETIGSHAREKHREKPYFWCFLCGECKEGKQLNHMNGTHHYCEICETWVSNPSDHHHEKHEDCFFCPLCLGSFKDGAEHTKNVHPDLKFCACGACLASFQVYESWHVAKHFVHCPLCKKAQPLSHMVTDHKCKEGVCKPIASTEELTWKWRCDPSCKNLIKPCPLERKGCKFTGSAEQLTVHMRDCHKCTQDCRFNESNDFVHGDSCRNGPAYCPICEREVPDRKQHWVKEHKCVEECPVASGSRTSGHSFRCEKWVGTCLMCGETNTDHEHRKKVHGCTEACVLSQSTDENGTYISVRHCGHRNDKVGKWVD